MAMYSGVCTSRYHRLGMSNAFNTAEKKQILENKAGVGEEQIGVVCFFIPAVGSFYFVQIPDSSIIS